MLSVFGTGRPRVFALFVIGTYVILSSQKLMLMQSPSSSPLIYEIRGAGNKNDNNVGHSEWRKQPTLPIWNSSNGIQITSLVDYTKGVLNATVEGHHIPTALYVIDDDWNLWTSDQVRRQYIPKLSKRIEPSEWLSLKSLNYLRQLATANKTHQWPDLERAIRKGGFPFLAYHKDFNGCNRHHWRKNRTRLSIPIFTLCARLDCEYSFPWPTYESISLAKADSREWKEIMAANKKKYATKKPMAVWRGSLTGTNNKGLEESIRWRLCQLSNNNSNLDARLVQIPEWRTDADPAAVNGLARKMNMEQFQNYAAVVDVDGNAWSSRFAALLCMDSVVLKVQPAMVDHFYGQVEPWIHYIPVSESLDDLIPKIEWVLAHPHQSDEIVDNAHRWCSQHMIFESLAKDVLNIWNSYVEKLDVGSAIWSEIWKRELPQLFQASNEMKQFKSFFREGVAS